MATHMTPKTPRNVAGFTLIDSMIAVVVLATGILALTLLQVSMLRSAAEARERSVAMTVAQNLLESQRALGAQTQTGYQNLAGSGVFASGACDYASSTVVRICAASPRSRTGHSVSTRRSRFRSIRSGLPM